MEFVPDMQLMGKPFNHLCGKAKFACTEEGETAFNMLKEALTISPVLAFPDIDPCNLAPTLPIQDTDAFCHNIQHWTGETYFLHIEGVL